MENIDYENGSTASHTTVVCRPQVTPLRPLTNLDFANVLDYFSLVMECRDFFFFFIFNLKSLSHFTDNLWLTGLTPCPMVTLDYEIRVQRINVWILCRVNKLLWTLLITLDTIILCKLCVCMKNRGAANQWTCKVYIF